MEVTKADFRRMFDLINEYKEDFRVLDEKLGGILIDNSEVSLYISEENSKKLEPIFKQTLKRDQSITHNNICWRNGDDLERSFTFDAEVDTTLLLTVEEHIQELQSIFNFPLNCRSWMLMPGKNHNLHIHFNNVDRAKILKLLPVNAPKEKLSDTTDTYTFIYGDLKVVVYFSRR
jgi:hypothetical protein